MVFIPENADLKWLLDNTDPNEMAKASVPWDVLMPLPCDYVSEDGVGQNVLLMFGINTSRYPEIGVDHPEQVMMTGLMLTVDQAQSLLTSLIECLSLIA